MLPPLPPAPPPPLRSSSNSFLSLFDGAGASSAEAAAAAVADASEQAAAAEASAAAAAAAAAAATAVGRAVYEVLRVDTSGKKRRIYVKRRDLLRANGLQPRDLRRVDPSLSLTRTAPSITVKESVLLINLGGVRAIIGANKCLLFEPASVSSTKFLEILVPRCRRPPRRGRRLLCWKPPPGAPAAAGAAGAAGKRPSRRPPLPRGPGRRGGGAGPATAAAATSATPPEEASRAAARRGRAPAAVRARGFRSSARRRHGAPGRRAALGDRPRHARAADAARDVTPVNLEELRRVKQALVELESRAVRKMEFLLLLLFSSSFLPPFSFSLTFS